MEQTENNTSFQFRTFKILKSIIEIGEDKPSDSYNLRFIPSAIIKKSESCFIMTLKVNINDDNKAINIEIQSIGEFFFQSNINKEELESYFYVNAPAILFPYIRAYITTLTTLSGINPIILPTLNLSALGSQLKANTTELNEN